MKILLVDDNKSITIALSKFLKLKGHDCIVVNDGRTGLSLCLEQKFDAVILDIAMPKFSGIDFVNMLNQSGKMHDQRIIILSAMPFGPIDLENSQKGISTVLQKPVDMDLLLETIEGKNRMTEPAFIK